MPMKTNRRQFIKISALGLGASALTYPMVSWMDAVAKPGDTPAGKESIKTPTYCELCFWKCAGWVHKDEDGEIWKITGN